MKQMKFFLVALMTVVMSVSVTSCMNGDDNTQVDNVPVMGKVTGDSFLSLTFTSLDGYTVKSKNSVEGAVNFMTGDLIVATCSYDRAVDIDEATKTINATISSAEKISGNSVWSTTKEEDEGENAMHKSNRGIVTLDDGRNSPFMIDNYNLVIPIYYFVHEKIESHTFSLVYYTNEDEMKGKNELKLYLRHTSMEEKDKEKLLDARYRAFNIREAISTFNRINERYPSNIIVVAEANTDNNDIPKTTTSYTVSYTFRE